MGGTIEERIARAAEELEREWETHTRWKGVERPYSAEDVVSAAGFLLGRADRRPRGAERLWQLGDRDRLRACAGSADRRPGGRDGQGRPAGDLPQRVAGGRGREPRRSHLPRSVPVPGELGAGGRATHQQRAAALPTRSHGARAPRPRSMVPIVADAEAGFGGTAQRVRADAGDDRGRRRRRALRGSAREREEVRAPRRQGPGADRSVRAHAHGRPAGGRRARRAVARGCAHRRARGDACSRATSTSATAGSSRANGRTKASTRCRNGMEAAIARAQAYAPYADLIWCETATPDLDEARDVRRRRARDVPRRAARLQLQPLVQLEAASRRFHDRALPEGARRDGVPVPVHHAGRVPRAEREHVRAGARLRRARA